MPIDIVNLEWQAHNKVRAYPLATDATRTDITGSFVLPDDFIIDIYLPVHAGLDVTTNNFHISIIQAYTAGFTVVIGYTNSSSEIITVASALIARAAHTPGQTYALGGIGDFADCIGRITIGDLDNIDLQPAGVFKFDLAGGRLDPDTIRPMIRYISSLQVLNGNDLSQKLTGDIVIKAGTNMSITLATSPGEDPILIFNAIDGAGLTQDCDCSDAPAGPINTINGIPPDTHGNFTITTNPCISLSPLSHGLQLTDTCSQPCCGPTELQVITQTIEQFQQQLNTLNSFVSHLQSVVDQMDLVVLGSRLGDRGCSLTE